MSKALRAGLALHLAGLAGTLLALRRVKVSACGLQHSPIHAHALATPQRDELDPPSHLCCSVTGELFTDPVVVLSTGHTYEREAIEGWWSRKPGAPTCPKTNLPCRPETCVNWQLRDCVNDYLVQHNQAPLKPPVKPPGEGRPAYGRLDAALDGPMGAALAMIITLLASVGGGLVATLFGCAASEGSASSLRTLTRVRRVAPIASLISVIMLLRLHHGDGGPRAVRLHIPALRGALGRW